MRPWMMALVLGLGTFALVITQQRDVDITRDETIYFAAGDRYVDCGSTSRTAAAR